MTTSARICRPSLAKIASINLGTGLQLIPTIAVRLVVFLAYFCFVLRQEKQNMSKQNILIHLSQTTERDHERITTCTLIYSLPLQKKITGIKLRESKAKTTVFNF
jgi:hypothetical protein